jgi:hypothetical protein
VQRVKRFARAVDLVMNSGRFPSTSKLLMPFDKFIAFSNWLFAETGARHGIALQRLSELLLKYLGDDARDALERDLGRDRASNLPKRQARHLEGGGLPPALRYNGCRCGSSASPF